MSKTEKLNNASFRGVPFLVPSEKVTRGQKVVLHKYPNRDDQYAEPLGKVPPIINLTCEVHGENFIQNRLRLEAALEQPGVGELVHPIYGAIDMQPGEFEVSSSQSAVGKFIFQIPFYKSTDISPTPSGAIGTQVSNQADLTLSNILDRLQERYVAPTNGFDLDIAVEEITGEDNFLDTVQKAIDSVVDPVSEAASNINTVMTSFRDRVSTIMQSGAELRTAVSNIYSELVNLTLIPEQLALAWSKLVDFKLGSSGVSSAVGPTNTVKRFNNENNKSIISEHARLVALVGFTDSISSTTYDTEDELINAAAIADDRYQKYYENNVPSDSDITALADDLTLRNSMIQLRVDSKKALDEESVNLWKVVDIDPGLSSSALTSYRYYGNLDQAERLTKLNPSIASSNSQVPIKAVTK